MRMLKRLAVLGVALAICAAPLFALDFVNARIADRLVRQGEDFDYVHKFGTNQDVDTGSDPEDVWVPGGLYVFPTVAAATTIVSAGADDAAAGTGARTVVVQGLDGSWMKQSETVTLNGTSAVTLTNTYLRVFRAWVATAGSGETNAGALTIAVDGTTVAVVPALGGQTQQAVYTIPNDYVEGYLVGIHASLERGNTARTAVLRLLTREDGGAWRVRDLWELSTTGSSTQGIEFPYWVVLQPKTDIVIRCQEVSANDTGISAWFDLVLRC